MPALTASPVAERVIDIGRTLSWYRHGAGDPTTWMRIAGRGPGSVGEFVRATHTPDGPGTVRVRWGAGLGIGDIEEVPGVRIDHHGPGGEWLATRVPAMLGVHDPGPAGLCAAPHAAVATAARHHRSVRHGASGDLYHELLPTIIAQRITSGEAVRQWHRLCDALGDPAPGPFTGLMLPPPPLVLARQPTWMFHPLGIERSRAQALVSVARHPQKLWEWATAGPATAAAKLPLLSGVGPWTVGSVLGPALGDADALAVGDYHLKNIIGWVLAGEPRATDERMLELLRPYAGERGRVARLLMLDGHRAPKFGPKQPVLPMHRW